jgi:hypothetical protein
MGLLEDMIDKVSSNTGLEIAAPYYGGRITASINRLLYDFQARDVPDVTGLSIWKVESATHVTYLRPPTRLEIKNYLSRLPRQQVVYLGPQMNHIHLLYGSQGFFDTLAYETHFLHWFDEPPRLPQLFQVIQAAYDGSRFWYVQEVRRLVAESAALRKAYVENVPPDELRVPYAPSLMKTAYGVLHHLRVKREEEQAAIALRKHRLSVAEQRRQAELALHARLEKELAFSGGRLVSYERERNGQVRVRFQVDGDSYTAVAHEDRAALHTAGICLNGSDHLFDLTGIVVKIREGVRRREINKTL